MPGGFFVDWSGFAEYLKLHYNKRNREQFSGENFWQKIQNYDTMKTYDRTQKKNSRC